MVFFDADHDQCLNITEFRSCVTGLGLVMTEEQITAKMAELDQSGDGRLNFEEFAQFMAVQVCTAGCVWCVRVCVCA
jgi:Ca2+-binding EF-hand superfamily protein